MNAEMNLMGYHPYALAIKNIEHFLVKPSAAAPNYYDEAVRVWAQSQYDLLLTSVTEHMRKRKVTGWVLDRLPKLIGFMGTRNRHPQGCDTKGILSTLRWLYPRRHDDGKWFILTPVGLSSAKKNAKRVGGKQIAVHEYTQIAKILTSIKSVAKWVVAAPRLTDELVLRVMFVDIRSCQTSMATHVGKKLNTLRYDTLSKVSSWNTNDEVRAEFLNYVEACIRGTPPEVAPSGVTELMDKYIAARDKIQGEQTDADLTKAIAFVKVTDSGAVHAIDSNGYSGGRCIRLPEGFSIPVDILQRVATLQINPPPVNAGWDYMVGGNTPGVGAALKTRWNGGSGAVVFANEVDYTTVFA